MEFFALPLFQSALALIVVWALFAITCTFIHETVVQIKSERGKFLFEQLTTMLDDKPNGINWGTLMYQHGSFDLLSSRVGDPVSQISPELFARSLVNAVSKSSSVQLALEGGNSDLWNALQKVTEVYRSSDVMEMLRLFIHEAQAGGKSGSEAIEHVQRGLAGWYTQYEREMTGRYKQLSKKRLFALGILLALFINLDSIQVFKHLANNPGARATIINYYKENEVRLIALDSAIQKGPDSIQLWMQDTANKKALQEGISQQNDLLPFLEPFWFKNAGKHLGTDWGWVLFLKIIGFILSGFAASLGAPFWFDVLKKAIKK
jgi:hypothetical protein